jgi:hypothetical protein
MSIVKIIVCLALTVFVSITVYLVVEKISGPDFSGNYVATPGNSAAPTGGDIKLPYLKLHLDQSGDSFKGFLDAYTKDSPKIRYEIISGNLDKTNHINLELHFESSVDTSANIGMFGISTKFAKMDISMHTIEPVKEKDVVITFEGLGELGGAMGLAMNALEFMIKGKINDAPKKEIVTFYRLKN